MKRNLTILPVLALGCALLAGCSKSKETTTAATPGGDQEPVLLQLKWAVGHRYAVHVTSIQAMEIQVPNAAQPAKQQTGVNQDFTVTVLQDLAGGGHELKLEITNMAMVTVSPNGAVVRIDSKADAGSASTNPAVALFQRLVGASVNYKVDAAGKIQAVEGTDDFLARVKGPGVNAQTEAMTQSMFTADSFKQMGTFDQGLPGKPVRVGDSWPLRTELSMGGLGRLTMNLKYTFKEWDQHEGHRCALLDYSGDITSEPGAAPGLVKSATIEKGAMTGTNWFDPVEGMMIDNQGEQKLEIRVDTGTQVLHSKVTQDTGRTIVALPDAK